LCILEINILISLWLDEKISIAVNSGSLFLIRPPGRPYVLPQMFIFYFFYFATGSPSSVGRLLWNFVTWSISGWILYCKSKDLGVPLKNLWAKHAKFGSFLHNFRLWSQIFLEQNKISKIGKTLCHVTENDSSRVQRNTSGELWSTIQKLGHVSLGPPKLTFSGDYISAPWGTGPWNFLHALDTGRAHHQLGQRSPK